MAKRSATSKSDLAPGRVFLSDRSIDDLSLIERYSTETWGRATAGKYLDSFEKFFSLLKVQPGVLATSQLGQTGLLYHCVEKHVVVCVRWQKSILVLTIVHGSRDLISLTDELLPTLKAEAAMLIDRLPAE